MSNLIDSGDLNSLIDKAIYSYSKVDWEWFPTEEYDSPEQEALKKLRKAILSLPTHEDRVKEVIEKKIDSLGILDYGDRSEIILEELLNELYPNN